MFATIQETRSAGSQVRRRPSHSAGRLASGLQLQASPESSGIPETWGWGQSVMRAPFRADDLWAWYFAPGVALTA